MKFETFGIGHLLPLFNGMLVTLRICAITILLASLLGLIIGIALTSQNKALAAICRGYVNIIRGIPLLVILFFVFYGIPMAFKLEVSQNAASIGSLTFYSSAYIAEIVRGSIQSIPKGQTEAALALGMNTLQRMGIVILPQAFRLMIPPLVGFFIALVKDSSLVSAIGYIDLTRAGKIVGNLTINPLLTFTFVAIFYFVICFSLSKLAKYSERVFSKNMRGGPQR
jgi:polar amino acid transport system permease protein